KPATVNSGSRVQIPIPPPPLKSPLRNQRAFFLSASNHYVSAKYLHIHLIHLRILSEFPKSSH
ncbi:hypothetical protein AB6C59_22885, partial [Vibrio splendidus]